MTATERIPITEDIINTLTAHKERTGCASIALMKYACDRAPDGLKPILIDSWLAKRIKSARKDHVEYVLQLWVSLEDNKTVAIDDTVRAKLTSERDRTGIQVTSLLKGRKDVPRGLRTSVASKYISGCRKTMPQEHLTYLLKAWREEPDDIMALHEVVLDKLKAHEQRTGLNAHALPHDKLHQSPGDFKCEMITAWLSCEIKSARSDYINFVLKAWESVPNKNKGSGKLAGVLHDTKVALTPEMLDQIKTQHQRTGIDEKALLKGDKDKPKGLTSLAIQSWLRGKCKTVPEDHFRYVMDKWQALPDKLQLPGYKPGKRKQTPRPDTTEIPADKLEKLRHYHSLGYLPGIALAMSDNKPKGLSPSMVGGWLRNVTTRAQPEFVTFVLDACLALETHPQRPILLDDQIIAGLVNCHDESGVSGGALLKDRKDIPQGMGRSTISAWIYGYIQTARKDQLDYVHKCYREILSQQRKKAAE